MHRIDSFGTAASLPATETPVTSPGYFIKGNPSTSTPATIVSQDWLNAVQEEIVGVVVAAGLTPSKANNAQLLAAILGLAQDYQEAIFAIANNQSTFANITGMLLDKTKHKSAIIKCDAYRKDAGAEDTQHLELRALYRPVADSWELLGPDGFGTDCGLEFDITSAGQVRYKSSNYAGGSYVGELRFKIERFKI